MVFKKLTLDALQVGEEFVSDDEVWVENQHGEKTAVGHATGLVS